MLSCTVTCGLSRLLSRGTSSTRHATMRSGASDVPGAASHPCVMTQHSGMAGIRITSVTQEAVFFT